MAPTEGQRSAGMEHGQEGTDFSKSLGFFFSCILAKKKKQNKSPDIFPFLEFVRLFVVVQNLLFSLFIFFNPPFSSVPVFLRPSSLSTPYPTKFYMLQKGKRNKNT